MYILSAFYFTEFKGQTEQEHGNSSGGCKKLPPTIAVLGLYSRSLHIQNVLQMYILGMSISLLVQEAEEVRNIAVTVTCL